MLMQLLHRLVIRGFQRQIVIVLITRQKTPSCMTVTVKVKTGKRRLIEFFLLPLLRYRQESIRER